MRIQPANLPYFFYGTLKRAGKYYQAIKDFEVDLKPAFVRGSLYANQYMDNHVVCETAALEPKGAQTIKGHLFHADPSRTLELQAILDEFEFNFHRDNGMTPGSTPRDRVYLRNIVVCHTEDGEAHLAWCYFYHSKKWPLKELIKPGKDGIVEFVEPTSGKSVMKSRDDYS